MNQNPTQSVTPKLNKQAVIFTQSQQVQTITELAGNPPPFKKIATLISNATAHIHANPSKSTQGASVLRSLEESKQTITDCGSKYGQLFVELQQHQKSDDFDIYATKGYQTIIKMRELIELGNKEIANAERVLNDFLNPSATIASTSTLPAVPTASSISPLSPTTSTTASEIAMASNTVTSGSTPTSTSSATSNVSVTSPSPVPSQAQSPLPPAGSFDMSPLVSFFQNSMNIMQQASQQSKPLEAITSAFINATTPSAPATSPISSITGSSASTSAATVSSMPAVSSTSTAVAPSASQPGINIGYARSNPTPAGRPSADQMVFQAIPQMFQAAQTLGTTLQQMPSTSSASATTTAPATATTTTAPTAPPQLQAMQPLFNMFTGGMQSFQQMIQQMQSQSSQQPPGTAPTKEQEKPK